MAAILKVSISFSSDLTALNFAFSFASLINQDRWKPVISNEQADRLSLLPTVDRTSIDEATFNASSMLLNFSFTKSKFLQQIVSVPC